ncbi:MAG: hypothetical protein H0V29_09465 [Thermoleophilaceae bacterium]|nr:hypothetical protein [Thermoleophilaceae bacterium]
MTIRKITAFGLALVALLGLAAITHGVVVGSRTTLIISPPPEANQPSNGNSDNSVVSQDGGKAKYVAWESTATNLVPGDGNSKKDVIVMERTQQEGNVGGKLSLGSSNSSGQPGNGDSGNPYIDGDSKRAPKCLVFESTSTNFDKADKRADSDIYLKNLNSKKTELVSDKGNAKNPSVDGECEFVVFDAGGKIFVRELAKDKTSQIARGSNADVQNNGKGVAYERGGQIYYTAFQKLFNKGNPIVKNKGSEMVVSKGSQGVGNGQSKNPDMDDNGYYVAFESTSTNLCTGLCTGVSGVDANGPISDIFRATISSRAPTKDKMQMASYSFGVQQQGNGASNNPAMTSAGENILFDSEATNLAEKPDIIPDANGPIRDIYYWNYPRERKTGNVSRESRDDSVPRQAGTGQPYNGPATQPAVSNRANYISFTANIANQSGDLNGGGISDIFLRFLGSSDEGRQD